MTSNEGFQGLDPAANPTALVCLGDGHRSACNVLASTREEAGPAATSRWRSHCTEPAVDLDARGWLLCRLTGRLVRWLLLLSAAPKQPWASSAAPVCARRPVGH